MARISLPPVRAEEKRPSSRGAQVVQRGVARANRAGLGNERRQDAESDAGRERTKGRMPVVSVRRDGTGNPEPRERVRPDSQAEAYATSPFRSHRLCRFCGIGGFHCGVR